METTLQVLRPWSLNDSQAHLFLRKTAMFPFEKLRVWNDARLLVKAVYSHTRDFPRSEVYGLTSQLNRAVVSVACNLAEGSARASRKDQAHFSQLAYSSLTEVSCLVYLCEDNGFLDSQAVAELKSRIESLGGGIHALRRSQVSRIEASAA